MNATPSQRRRGALAQQRGLAMEGRAAHIMQQAGWQVLAQRLRPAGRQAGEIDLLLTSPTTLVALEVKARPTLEGAAHALRPGQLRRLHSALGVVLAQHPEWVRPEARLDCMIFDAQGRHLHLANIYQPDF
ncbi:YraN family protein [Formicincola oecophyllae]|uniref:YraN family protein n=1 Tax=Formicincola oecophyllae TaxID=2558361 RepID=A0A4Y6UC04_9PROT|nr:YraN family protein [Formicincola oecophyllae]QDH14006.1 YraN family protein [Formicincola oecophyllae]